MMPSFIIAGAQKAGSTVIQLALDEHPDVFIPEPEIPFFEEPDYSKQTLTDLERYFENANPNHLFGIKRPNYFGKPECAENIHRDLPSAKIIVCLRNPVDRFISGYFHMMTNGFIPVQSPEKGIPQVLQGELQKRCPRSVEILEFGFYGKHLQRFYQYFPKEQILVMLYDDLVADSLTFIHRVYDYLGLKPITPNSLNSRPQSTIYDIERLQLLTLGNRFKYTYNDNRTRLAVKKQSSVDRFALKMIQRIDYRLFKNRNHRDPIAPDIRAMLYDAYRDDIHKLENLLNRPLPTWHPKES